MNVLRKVAAMAMLAQATGPTVTGVDNQASSDARPAKSSAGGDAMPSVGARSAIWAGRERQAQPQTRGSSKRTRSRNRKASAKARHRRRRAA